VLDGGPQMLRDVAIATNFETKIAMTGFYDVGLYGPNESCVRCGSRSPMGRGNFLGNGCP